jgi:hypothetical protein
MPLIVINNRVRLSKREKKRLLREQKRVERLEIKPQNTAAIKRQKKQKEIIKNKELKETEAGLLELQGKRPHDMRVHKRLMKFYIANKMWAEVEEQQEILEMLDRIKRINARKQG